MVQPVATRSQRRIERKQVILIVALKTFKDANEAKTNVLVSSALSKIIWQDIVSQKIDGESFGVFLDNLRKLHDKFHFELEPEEDKTPPELKAEKDKLKVVCISVVKQFLPDGISIKSCKVDVLKDAIGCFIIPQSSLPKKPSFELMDAFGFKNGLFYKHKVPLSDELFYINLMFLDVININVKR